MKVISNDPNLGLISSSKNEKFLEQRMSFLLAFVKYFLVFGFQRSGNSEIQPKWQFWLINWIPFQVFNHWKTFGEKFVVFVLFVGCAPLVGFAVGAMFDKNCFSFWGLHFFRKKVINLLIDNWVFPNKILYFLKK